MKKNKKKSRLILLGLTAAATVATVALINKKRHKTTFKVRNVKITSKRLTNIYCTINVCDTDKMMPLVIFAHGFGADRHEGGRFSEVADNLAAMGIASIRMDFPGCNQSEESFTAFAIRNMLDDIATCIEYMISNYQIDQQHMGMIGYSMGGRLAVIYAAANPKFKTLALWAPALTHNMEGLEDFMGGVDKLNEMIKVAEKKGYVRFKDIFDNDKIISKEYYEDMAKYDPLAALNTYKDNLLIVQGNKDDIVTPTIINKALRYVNKECNFNYLYMDHANHGFGLWDEHPEQSAKLVKATTKFFERYL